jgi:hypothetical protein
MGGAILQNHSPIQCREIIWYNDEYLKACQNKLSIKNINQHNIE